MAVSLGVVADQVASRMVAPSNEVRRPLNVAPPNQVFDSYPGSRPTTS